MINAFRRRIAGRKAALFSAVLTVGAMLLVAPTAQAAPSAGLSGAFSVAEVVTVSQNVVSEPVGFSATVSWTFVPVCTAGPCDTQLTRHRTNGSLTTYTVTPDTNSNFTGNTSYSGSCYSNADGQLIAQDAYTDAEAIQITPTASSGGLVTAFKGTLSITGTPTAIGTTNNCNPSYEVITFTGTTTTPPPIISDSYASVEYIEGFSVSGCTSDLLQHGIYGSKAFLAASGGNITAAATLLCRALRSSANSAPPSSLDAQTVGTFEASQEYRGFMMVPSYQLNCSASGEVLSVALAGNSPFYASLGFTRDPLLLGALYQSGESYNPQDPTFDTGVPTIVTDPDGAVTISYRWASRIATLERKAQYYISGYDAPYVWLTFDEKIGCNGQQVARFNFTDFPATDLYINGSEVSHDAETNNFAKFIKQGGKTLNPVGHGNLAFPCHVKQFDNGNAQPTYSYKACQDGRLPPGAGTGGGGTI